MKFLKLFLIVFLMLPVISFSAPKKDVQKVEDVLSGKEFYNEKYPEALIGFRKGAVYGYAVINTYMGLYEVKSNKDIRLSYMGYTKLSGTRKQEEAEFNYFDKLEKVKEYSYDNKTGVLMLGTMKFIEKK